MKTGAIVGLPYHFRYQKLSDIDFDRLTLKNQSIDWNSEHGEKFADSLILSNNAKKFAIAHEIYYVLDQHIGWDSCLLLVNFGAAYCGYFALKEFYQLKRRVSLFSRMTILGTFGLVALGVYNFMSDIYQRRRDWKSLKNTSRLGTDFIEGGIEFYNKLLQRNSALYHLLGEKGSKLYTITGNEKISFRMKHLPITYQRDMLKEILAKMESEKKEENRWWLFFVLFVCYCIEINWNKFTSIDICCYKSLYWYVLLHFMNVMLFDKLLLIIVIFLS